MIDALRRRLRGKTRPPREDAGDDRPDEACPLVDPVNDEIAEACDDNVVPLVDPGAIRQVVQTYACDVCNCPHDVVAIITKRETVVRMDNTCRGCGHVMVTTRQATGIYSRKGGAA